MLFPLLSWTPQSETPNSIAPEYNDACCPLAIKSLTPHSMARISMTPNSMAPKSFPVFERSINWEPMSSEASFGSVSPQTSSESTLSETMSTETKSEEKISEQTISEESTPSDTNSVEESPVGETSSEVVSSQAESSEPSAEDTNTSKTSSTCIVIEKVRIPKEKTSDSKATLTTLTPIDTPTNPLIVPEAIFKIKSKPSPPTPTGEASKSNSFKKTLTFDLMSSKGEFISSKAIVTKEIPTDPKPKAFHPDAKLFDLSRSGTVLVQPHRLPKIDQRRRNISPAHSRLKMNNRCWPPKEYQSGQKHNHPSYPSTTLTVAKLPMANYKWISTSKSLSLRGIRQTTNKNSIFARSNIPTIIIPRVINSTFIHANVRNPQFVGSNLMEKAIIPTKEGPRFMAKTINSNLMRKGFNSRFMARGMNPQLMATRMINPNIIIAARAMVSRGILAEVLAAKALTRQSLALVPRTPRKIDRKTLSFPGTLRDDEALLPFKLLPSVAEERSLETMEIWIATCPPKSIPAVINFIKEHLIPRDISAGASIIHLFRVRKIQLEDNGLFIRELLLCAKESIARQELESLLWTHTDPALHPRLAVASRWPALTRKQYESFSKFWPVKGKPERKRALPRNISIQISDMKKFITAAIHLSQRVYRIQDKPPYNLPIATLIVDPSTSRILASTYDTRISTNQPLNHSVLTAINLLAMSPQPSTRQDRYYAFGYDFYTTHEPCLMCCMALSHSRARRCVFWKEMKYTGGTSLGWKKELNHKYMIFQWAGDESVIGEGVVENLPCDICA